MNAYKATNHLTKINDETAFFDEVKTILEGFGVKAFSYLNMSWVDHSSNMFLETPSLNYWFSSASPAWCERYSEMNYSHVDPVFSHLLKTRSPFIWDTDFGNTEIEQQMMQDAALHGYGAGMSVPLYGPKGDCSTLTIFADETKTSIHEWAEGFIHEFEILASNINKLILNKFVEKKEFSISILGPREVECLDWSSQGKTAKEIGTILGISERTVRFHLGNIRNKFEVSTTSQAIAIYNSRRGSGKGQRV